MYFKGDIIITDPCYVIKDIDENDDWDKCEGGHNMEILGFHTYLTSTTGYGDWSCTTYNSDTGEKLGNFCADSGMVSVFLLDEVLNYNPDYDDYIKNLWTTTYIKYFDGEINIIYSHDKDYEDFLIVRVEGKGNVNFITSQTGF